MNNYPTPHQEKLLSLLENDKLPRKDQVRVELALKFYHKWIGLLNQVTEYNYHPDKTLIKLIKLLNIYKFYIDVNLIFDSPDDFLYRQKGQLKVDNSIIEEFLPRLTHPILIPELEILEVEIGPITAFSSIYFESSLNRFAVGGGIKIQNKAQDFAISKPLFLKASHSSNFTDSIMVETNLAYLVAECKTNLDKTMFQEGCATAHDLKSAVPGAKYFLLCEWLDMTPISTAPTDIDQVLILRKSRRINSNKRKEFSTFSGRQKNRNYYVSYLQQNPFRVEIFKHLINNIRMILNQDNPQESDVLELGYF
jgi:Bpu10I restriction endonuclease